MKKVFISILTLYNGGAERSLINFLNALPKDEYEIDLMLFKNEGLFLKQVPPWVHVLSDDEKPEGLKRLYGPIAKSGKYIPLKFFGTSVSKVFERKNDYSGFRWKYFYEPSIAPLKKQYDIALAYLSGEVLYFVDEKVTATRKIAWIHNDYKSTTHPVNFDYPHLKNMDRIVTISDKCLDILKDVFPELANRMLYLPNISSENMIKAKAEEFIPKEYDANIYTILSIGRICAQKGYDYAIDAAKILQEKGIKFHWFIMGEGPLLNELSERVYKFHLEQYVKFIGTRENPYPYIKFANLIAQTSRFEGKSVVLDEAKIMGKVVLATDYPTVKDQIISGKTGWIVDMEPEAIARGIELLMSNNQLTESIDNYLKNNKFGNQDDIQKYIDLLEGKL